MSDNPLLLQPLSELLIFLAPKDGSVCVMARTRTPETARAAIKLAELIHAAWPGSRPVDYGPRLGIAAVTPPNEEAMTTKTIGKVKLNTDATGKTRLTRVHAYDASKQRRIAKSKKVTVKRK